MRIFVSHSHEEEGLAAFLATRLRADGHHVFQNDGSLERGRGFDGQIREQLDRCDLFVFLLSPASVRPGCYARTELGLAEKRWPNPALRVLPAMARDTDEAAVPPYLKAVNILRPSGELIAEIVNEVARRTRRARRRTRVLASLTALTVMGLAGIAFRPAMRAPAAAPPPIDVEPASAQAAAVPQVNDARTEPAPPPVRPRPRAVTVARDDPPARSPADVLWEREGCSARIERKNGQAWAVCRCPDGRLGDRSVPLTTSALARARVELAGRWACP